VNAEAEMECNGALDVFVMVGHAEPRQAGKVKTMAASLASASVSGITLLASSTDGVVRPAWSGSSSLDQFRSKTEHLENAEDRLGMLELPRLKLGIVKPLLDRFGLSPPVFLQHPGGLIHRQFLLFLSNDFHILFLASFDPFTTFTGSRKPPMETYENPVNRIICRWIPVSRQRPGKGC